MHYTFRAFLVAVASTFVAGTSAANDTSASIDAGGLIFERSTAVSIASEVLYISLGKIEVDYVFANRTHRDVTTVVAFPLPDLDLQHMWASPSSIPFEGKENFVGFQTWVDGKEIQMQSDVRAILKDRRDVTQELKSLGINLFTAKQELDPEVHGKLIKIGAVIDTRDEVIPTWITKTNFYWTQTFPAGKRLHVKHVYNAGPFKSFVRDQEAEWCTDDAYKAAFAKLPKYNDPYMDGEAVRYVLKTGANWSGPIGDFVLKLDKAGTALLSTCPIPALSLKKEGNMFVAHATNYTPTTDLNVLFVHVSEFAPKGH
jgi:Domain of unknown function (DUF4424)